MKMISVESSNLSKVGYDPKEELLVVEFVKGGRYEYKGVPSEIFKMIMNSDSKGSAFHKYIKNKNYKYEKTG